MTIGGNIMNEQMKEQNVQFIIPVNNGEFVAAYKKAVDAKLVLKSFLETLNGILFRRDSILQNIHTGIRLVAGKGEAVMIVEAQWLGRDWTAKAAEDKLNLYIEFHKDVDYENHDHDDEYYDPDDDGFN
jgi:hypothetical protein